MYSEMEASGTASSHSDGRGGRAGWASPGSHRSGCGDPSGPMREWKIASMLTPAVEIGIDATRNER